MEDDVGLEALHHLEHPVGLLAVGQHRLDAGEVPLLDHLAVDLEEVVLGVVEHHQQLGRTRAIWRTSSEPIEPPAPVTRTTLSCM